MIQKQINNLLISDKKFMNKVGKNNYQLCVSNKNQSFLSNFNPRKSDMNIQMISPDKNNGFLSFLDINFNSDFNDNKLNHHRFLSWPTNKSIHKYHLKKLYFQKINDVLNSRSIRFKGVMGSFIFGLTSSLLIGNLKLFPGLLSVGIVSICMPRNVKLFTSELWELIDKNDKLIDIIDPQYQDLYDFDKKKGITLSIDFFGNLYFDSLTLRDQFEFTHE